MEYLFEIILFLVWSGFTIYMTNYIMLKADKIKKKEKIDWDEIGFTGIIAWVIISISLLFYLYYWYFK